jgi:hypothetical protein
MTNTFGRWDSRLVSRIGSNKKLNPTLNKYILCIKKKLNPIFMHKKKSKCNFTDNRAYLNECLRLKSWDFASMLGLDKIAWVGLGVPCEPTLRMQWSRAFSLACEVALRMQWSRTLSLACEVALRMQWSRAFSLACEVALRVYTLKSGAPPIFKRLSLKRTI